MIRFWHKIGYKAEVSTVSPLSQQTHTEFVDKLLEVSHLGVLSNCSLGKHWKTSFKKKTGVFSI